MDNYQDLRNKKILPFTCDCNFEGFVFLSSLENDYETNCPKCGKKIYGVNCPKCGAGYAYPVGSKDLNVTNSTWFCSMCKTTNKLTPAPQVHFYALNELPEDLQQKAQTQNKIGSFNLYFILFQRLLTYVILAIILRPLIIILFKVFGYTFDNMETVSTFLAIVLAIIVYFIKTPSLIGLLKKKLLG